MRLTTRFSLFAATAFAFSAIAEAQQDGIMYLVTTTQMKSVAGKDSKGEQIEIQSFSWGPRQSTSNDGARTRAGNQVIMDDTAGREKMQPGGGGGGGAAGASESLTVGANRTETASGQATGKRQHKPLAMKTYYDAPLPQGSVRVKVKMPWLACRVGATYPRLELGGGGKTYVLEDVRVASCGGRSASGDADDRPTEEVAFYYNSIM